MLIVFYHLSTRFSYHPNLNGDNDAGKPGEPIELLDQSRIYGNLNASGVRNS